MSCSTTTVTDGIRELIRRDAEQICVGKRAGEHSVPQHDTNQMLIAAAKAGKTVVRLKGAIRLSSVVVARSCRRQPKRASRSGGSRHYGGVCRHGLRRYSADPSRLRPERDLCDRAL